VDFAELRQKAVANHGGYMDWGEMVDFFAFFCGNDV
jgi:hypothetical protein